MALRLTERVVEFLRQSPNQRFTGREIADWVVANYPDECDAKMRKSKSIGDDDLELLAQRLVAEINGRRYRLENRGVKSTEESHPRMFYFTESTNSEEIDAVESPVQLPDTNVQPLHVAVQSPYTPVQAPHTPVSSPQPPAQKRDFTEHDLYPKLSKFLRLELEVHSKRINEGRSSNSRGSGGNKWLHPDVVGFENLSHGWHTEIKKFAKQHQGRYTRLWSFEVKKSIDSGSLRQDFFQTVSNSSWANFGYLVACEFRGTNIREEMRILAGLHGIGFIKLNFETPAKSDIIIPARERSEVDWDTANRLAENTDFKDYIEFVIDFYIRGKIDERDWDYKPSDDSD